MEGKTQDNARAPTTKKQRNLWTNRNADTVITMPSMTSTAVTQANQDNQIQTVTIRGRRDEGQSECTDNRKVIGLPLVKMNINNKMESKRTAINQKLFDLQKWECGTEGGRFCANQSFLKENQNMRVTSRVRDPAAACLCTIG